MSPGPDPSLSQGLSQSRVDSPLPARSVLQDAPSVALLYLPKSARAYLFPQSVKVCYFCSGPVSVDPILSLSETSPTSWPGGAKTGGRPSPRQYLY